MCKLQVFSFSAFQWFYSKSSASNNFWKAPAVNLGNKKPKQVSAVCFHMPILRTAQIQAVSWLLRRMLHTNVECHVGVIAVCLYLWSVTSCFRQGHFKKTPNWQFKMTRRQPQWGFEDHNKNRVLSCTAPQHLSLSDWPLVSCYIFSGQSPCLKQRGSAGLLRRRLMPPWMWEKETSQFPNKHVW